MNNENNVAPINEDLNVVKYELENIKNMIYTIRGKQVILDSDIARLYEEEKEYESLRSQFATLKIQGRGQHRKYLPYAFTEQGVAMLSAVLHTDKAIKVSINIINAFIEMRKFILNNQMLFEKISNIELKQIEYQKSTDDKFEKVFEYIGEHKEKEQKIFFNDKSMMHLV